ncbi:MAG: class I SAM-dependent methyltransferase [Verrucomicrobiota bacterium]
MSESSHDQQTASAFATSWNNLPEGSVYSREQFEDWIAPLKSDAVRDQRVLELGCGNGSLLLHMLQWQPSQVTGIDLGDSVRSAKENLAETGQTNWEILQDDLVAHRGELADLVYCIGVLHHLKEPEAGFRSVLENTSPGGRFHCWVYAKEGNLPVRLLVEPLRKLCCQLPWWLTKYGAATPLSLPVYLAARLARVLPESVLSVLPLGHYLHWLGQREWSFARHVVFDQLVTPQTVYLDRPTIESWLRSAEVDPDSTYVIFRNRNSWKFGGTRLAK